MIGSRMMQYFESKGTFSVPMMQRDLNIDYKSARNALKELESNGKVIPKGELYFTLVGESQSSSAVMSTRRTPEACDASFGKKAAENTGARKKEKYPEISATAKKFLRFVVDVKVVRLNEVAEHIGIDSDEAHLIAMELARAGLIMYGYFIRPSITYVEFKTHYADLSDLKIGSGDNSDDKSDGGGKENKKSDKDYPFSQNPFDDFFKFVNNFSDGKSDETAHPKMKKEGNTCTLTEDNRDKGLQFLKDNGIDADSRLNIISHDGSPASVYAAVLKTNRRLGYLGVKNKLFEIVGRYPFTDSYYYGVFGKALDEITKMTKERFEELKVKILADDY